MRLLVITRNAVVAVDGQRFVEPEGVFDLVLEFPDAEARPGLINAHDHLHRNHYGRLGRPPYANAYDWARDIQARDAEAIAAGRAAPRRHALLAGAWKNLAAGVTTVVHHDAREPDFETGFPIRVPPVASADSLGMTPELGGLDRDGPCAVHMAEGVDEAAAAEVHALAERGLLSENLLAVHGVGVDRDGADRFRESGATLIWCPTSNLFLFGRTASEAMFDGDVLLGSDSRLTGDGDLLDELRRARALGALDDARLEAAVGSTAARRLGLPEPGLEPGAEADFVVLARPLLEATAHDVLLVVVGGVIRLAHPDLGPRLNPFATTPQHTRIGSITRWVDGPIPAPSSMRSFP
jgi:hypothetical protein